MINLQIKLTNLICHKQRKLHDPTPSEPANLVGTDIKRCPFQHSEHSLLHSDAMRREQPSVYSSLPQERRLSNITFYTAWRFSYKLQNKMKEFSHNIYNLQSTRLIHVCQLEITAVRLQGLT